LISKVGQVIHNSNFLSLGQLRDCEGWFGHYLELKMKMLTTLKDIEYSLDTRLSEEEYEEEIAQNRK
jgi:hypothetical protein